MPPLYLLSVTDLDGVLAAEGYYSDAAIPEGERYTDGITTITIPQNLPAGLRFICNEDLEETLENSIIFTRSDHG